jgi:CNT family concentrative nucleoside transporter
MLIAFTALIALASGIFEFFTKLFTQDGITLQRAFGYLFSPIAFFMGIPLNETVVSGSLIADKTILNEFVAYANFADMTHKAAGSLLSVKTEVILSYALCGFANFSSIGIQIGGISPLAPERRADLSKYGLYAMLAGLLASCFRAAVVGLLM